MAKRKTKFWNVKTDDKDDTLGHLYLYGIIAKETWWGDEVTPTQMKNDIESLGEIDTLRVHIFSDGGDCFAGHAILSMLKQHPAYVEAYIEGIAASMATVVPMGADAVYISTTGMMLVHNPMYGLCGYYNKAELSDMITDLEKIKEPLVAAYTSHTGVGREEVIAWMDGEKGQGTWFTAQEALDAGLVDGYIPEEAESELAAVASLGNSLYRWQGKTFDLSDYAPAPKAITKRKEKTMAGFFKKRLKAAKVANADKGDNTIEVTCPECGHAFEVEGVEGDEVTCPECDHAFVIGETSEDNFSENASNDRVIAEVDEDGGSVEITCPECGEVYEVALEEDVEEQSAICPECGHEVTISSAESGEADESEEGTADARFAKGVAAERKRIADLDSIAEAMPDAAGIVAQGKKQGWSYDKTSKKVMASIAQKKKASAAKGDEFLSARKKAYAVTSKVGATPNKGNAEGEEGVEDISAATARIVKNYK